MHILEQMIKKRSVDFHEIKTGMEDTSPTFFEIPQFIQEMTETSLCIYAHVFPVLMLVMEPKCTKVKKKVSDRISNFP